MPEPIPLSSEGLSTPKRPAPPRLPGHVVMRADVDEAIDALLAEVLIHAHNCVRAFGDFQLAISPRPNLEPVLRRMMYDLNLREFPWSRTRLWLTEDVLVAEDDPKRLGTLVQDLIVAHADLPMEQFHPPAVWAENAAAAYEERLREVLGWREKGHDRLDCVLMALDADAGVGAVSAPARVDACGVEEATPLVREVQGDGGVMLAMTPTMINASRLVCVYAAGEPVHSAVKRVVEAARDPSRVDVPATVLRPIGGDLRWYVDEGVAAARGN